MPRSRAVDALRAVAVLLVLCHHLDTGGWVDATPWLAPLRETRAVGFLGVSLFLVLSGFSIHLRAAAGGSFRTGQFLRRRFLRLHPAYYAAIVFALCLYAMNSIVRGGSVHANWGFSPAPMPVWALVLVHLTILPATILPAGWLMVTWSLALEEHLYLIYALCLARMRRTSPTTWLLVALAVGTLWRIGAQLIVPSVPKSLDPVSGSNVWIATVFFQQAPARLFEWLLGAAIAEWYVGKWRLPRAVTWRPVAAGLLAATWWLFRHRAGYVDPLGHPVALTDFIWDPFAGIAFGTLVVSCLAAERRSHERRSDERRPGPLVWLGERSYSLYLVHLPIFQTTFSLLRGTLPPAYGRQLEALIALVAAFGAAILLYKYVEAPATAWSKRAPRRRQPDRPETPSEASSDQRYAAASAPL